ncbi:hypothetical protein JYU34_012715 [Plutella xylostella]|uniref:Uncharacterized protein n=1 Tax=Plutella xylostella TaxID=51655 RepID=A0ABQ7QFL1_PLUXY|nr:hypothetical protein JYU34_012715 [Plutella xylostella]
MLFVTSVSQNLSLELLAFRNSILRKEYGSRYVEQAASGEQRKCHFEESPARGTLDLVSVLTGKGPTSDNLAAQNCSIIC